MGVRWERLLPWLGVVLFFCLALLGDKGLLRLWHVADETTRLRTELDTTTAETTLLEKEIRALKTDPRYIERVAREDLGLVRQGEVLYRFKE